MNVLTAREKFPLEALDIRVVPICMVKIKFFKNFL